MTENSNKLPSDRPANSFDDTIHTTEEENCNNTVYLKDVLNRDSSTLEGSITNTNDLDSVGGVDSLGLERYRRMKNKNRNKVPKEIDVENDPQTVTASSDESPSVTTQTNSTKNVNPGIQKSRN